ncbi:MAG: small ribosomal subunit Rsm22 family protein [Bdellovibrionota bacterium]
MFPVSPSEKLQTIADAILKLSDYYINNPLAETPWHKKYCQIAYRHYYLPLNFIRCEKVIERGLQVNFFENLTHFIDWGAGPGTASLALAKSVKLKAQIKKQVLFDLSKSTMNQFSDLHVDFINKDYFDFLDLRTDYPNKQNSCLLFSYSLTEVTTLPAGWDEYEALMILEPSTSQDGRKLLNLRQNLIENGYTIWAPCTHQQSCPLLNHSKNDWCHDRAHVAAPKWFNDLEQLLPMKNKTVTTSYLLARKRKPKEKSEEKTSEIISAKARLTGDSLNEKGKTRQLICRNDQREFLTWMHKTIEPQIIARGELIDLPTDFEIKSNELRLKNPLKIPN